MMVTFVKVVTAAVAMGFGAWYAELLLRDLFPGASVPRQAARLAAAIVVALAVLDCGCGRSSSARVR